MNILVLIKMVSKLTYSDAISADMSDNRLENGSLDINPADRYALELALRIKDTCTGTRVSVMTMAPDNADGILRNAIAMGADEAIHVSDRYFASSDTIATSKTLATAIEKSGEYDYIICGKKAIDSETGHIGPQIAELLGMELVSNILTFENINDKIKYVRTDDYGKSEGEVMNPAVLTVVYGTGFIREPKILAMRKARNTDILKYSASDLGLNETETGSNASGTETILVKNVSFSFRSGTFETYVSKGVDYIFEQLCSFRNEQKNTCLEEMQRIEWIQPSGLRKELLAVTGKISSATIGFINKCDSLAKENNLEMRVISIENEKRDNAAAAINTLMSVYNRACTEAIIFERTSFLADIAPAFACRISRGITADCTELEWDAKYGLLQIRPTFGGRKIAVNISKKKPYIATVRRGVFSGDRAIVTSENSSLETAEIILSGGLGLKKKENYEKMTQLAKKIGAMYGASRAAVSAGFTDYTHQVGQTGVTVHPRLYIAFGISGAVQHLSGIIGSERIISVNTDIKAPIRDFSNYYFNADAGTVIEELLKRIGQRDTK